MDCSVIIPVYYNEGSLVTTFRKVQAQLEASKHIGSYEIIFIDDGSADNSYAELKTIKSANYDVVKLIKLTRNFGQVSAMKAGYRYAKGRCIINISADLQDPPELIGNMLDAFYIDNKEVVICNRTDREESWYRKKTSRIFYKMMQKLTFKNMPIGGFDYALISGRVADTFRHNNESNSFWQGQVLWGGYTTKFIPYQRLKREIGESRWTFTKKIKYLIDGVLAYSYFPMRFMTGLGIICFLGGILYALLIVMMYFLGDIPYKGWAPIMILVLILSGIQMLMLGIIGEYLWRTLDQTRDRPSFLIDEIIE
jgi:glycosyltransferase involved in cell wall biosynthesis